MVLTRKGPRGLGTHSSLLLSGSLHKLPRRDAGARGETFGTQLMALGHCFGRQKGKHNVACCKAR